MSDSVERFTLAIPEARIVNLRERLANMVRSRDDRRHEPRAAARYDPNAVRVLAYLMQLVVLRIGLKRPRAIHDRNRRTAHPFPTRTLARACCAAVADDARLARFRRLILEGHRSAHRPDEPRRSSERRVSSGAAVVAGFRILRKADGNRLGACAHRRRLDLAHG